MPTAIVSDLHLGAASGADAARLPAARGRLLESLAGADRIVLLGDALELRERPLARVLELARPLFEALGEVAAGRRVTLVPGNHDHALADPWLSRARVDGRPLALEAEWPVEPGDGPAGRLGAWLGGAEVTLAYPGLRVRDDVYVTHGHYLDLLLTVPRLESIAATALRRLAAPRHPLRSPGDYESVLAPLYALFFSLAQGASRDALRRGSSLSRSVWARASDGRGEGRAARFLLGRVTIPGAVAALNRVGIGPFSPDLSGPELRRSGLRAIAAVLDSLGVEAEHVVFGHTHRPGPLAGDEPAEWRTGRGARLWNSGSWYHETVFFHGDPEESPYWPGTVVRVPDEGEPELVNALRGLALPAGPG